MTDTERFSELLKLPPESMSVQSGVGTLSEKYLHALLKNFFEPDKSCHEVKVGRFTADILHSDNSITEIQTRSLNKLREKLEYYLLEGHKVRVVYPFRTENGLSGSTRKQARQRQSAVPQRWVQFTMHFGSCIKSSIFWIGTTLAFVWH